MWRPHPGAPPYLIRGSPKAGKYENQYHIIFTHTNILNKSLNISFFQLFLSFQIGSAEEKRTNTIACSRFFWSILIIDSLDFEFLAAESIHTYLRVFLQVSNRIKIIIKILKKKQFFKEDKSKIKQRFNLVSICLVSLVMKSLKNGKRVTN